MKKRFLSIAVILTMLLSFIPTNIAFAATGQEVVDYAYNTWKGTPWKSYTEPYGPGIGVDCSYLVQNAYNHFGYSLPRTTYDQRYQGTSVDLSGLKYSHDYSALKPGDVIFFNNYEHVGLYAGNGNFVHTSYSRGVVRQVLYGDGYNWHQYACEVRRIIDSPTPHTHSWTYGNDASHPHREYRTCSCGEKQYTGKTRLIASCSQCYPLGNVNLTRSFERVSRSATFYRNNVVNANSYTLTLYKDGASYNTYNMSSTEKTVSSLASGTYTATLTAKNTNTNQSKTANTLSFTIVDTYDVAFDANGGTNAPSAQTKIKDEDLTLTSAEPKRAHYIFNGWAANRNETEPQYLAGGTYTKNTRITLYAVWEPETYTINFDTNGGKGEVESATITYGNTMKMPNTVVRDGYYLKGWSKTKSATTPDYKLGLDHMLDSNMTLYAVWGQSTWGGTVATEFAGGDGTEENPYQISNAAELAHLADKVNNQQSEPAYEYYILTDNIDLGYKEWIPIGLYGNENQYFKGSFDGNGYTISDLNITDINEGYVGLFGYAKDGEIKGLTVSGDITGITSELSEAYIGAIVANSVYTNIVNCNISYVNISNIDTNKDFIIGGIVGCVQGNVEQCVANQVYIGIDSIGGYYLNGGYYLIGIISGSAGAEAKIQNCEVYSSEELFGVAKQVENIMLGGICGAGYEIYNCQVEAGSLTNNINSSDTIYGGGIVGYATHMVWSSDIHAEETHVKNCSVIFKQGKDVIVNGTRYKSSINIDTDTAHSKVYLGGIVGHGSNCIISNCSYDGESIIANMKYAWYTKSYLGGINGVGGKISKCFANISGAVYGNLYSGNIDCKDKNNGICVYGIGGSSASNVVAIADEIYAVSDTTVSDLSGGDIIGGTDYSKVHSYSNMTVKAQNTGDSLNTNATTNIIGTRRTLAQIKRTSFLKTVFGPEYQSLAHLEEDPEAVWVIKDGEYPELYFTVLNDITVSDVEHGTISVDKTQAVDDEIVTVSAVPDEGYKLNKIYVNGEEITGTTFPVAGNADVYATFAEIPAEYKVSVAANANASAGLVNVDDTANTKSLQSVSLFSDNQALTATDGEEIKVNTHAAADYTVDAIYVNGEELAGDSFIVTDDSVVTMDAVSISTDVKATTYEAKNIRANGATLSGKVDGDESSSKYIRYWRADTPSEIYTTEVETGSGEYSAEVTDLEPYVEYEYQMTEFGDVKSFTPEYVPVDDSGTEPVEPTEEPTKRDMCFEIQNQSKGKFSVSANVVNTTDEVQSGLVIYAAYDGNGKLVKVETETITDLAANGTFPVEFAIADGAEKYKILVWDSWKSMLPIAASVDIE